MEENDPFALIAKGNAFEAATNHWGSADMYSQASTCLRIRADKISSQLAKDAAKKQEQRKIISLYRAQSLEYLYKARHCFIEAVKFENDQDRNRMLEVVKSGKGTLDPLSSMITTEESERRRFIFQTLFLGQQDDVDATEVNHDGHDQSGDDKEKILNIDRPATNDAIQSAIQPARDIKHLQESMEARLAKLNLSIASNETIPKAPPPFISGSRSGGSSGGDEQSRLDNIHRGLKGLGISLPDNGKSKDFIPDNLSGEDQVKLIIQQAQDEVMIENGDEVDNSVRNDSDEIDETDSMFNGLFEDELDGDDINSLLTNAENLVAKKAADDENSSLSLATMKLAQLQKVQALLLEARMCLEVGDGEESNSSDSFGNQNDNGNDIREESDIESKKITKPSRVIAKEKIEDANECLSDILAGWIERW